MCCGCLPDICKEGCCRVPFYVYTPETDGSIDGSHVGKIVKLWAGFGNELLGIHKFSCEFPKDADAATKTRLVGATLLLNEIYFKNDQNNNN